MNHRTASPRISTPLGRPHAIINCPNSQLEFIILDCPTESTLNIYIEEFKQLNVSLVVRCCQRTYNEQRLVENGIEVKEMSFKDGGVPSPKILAKWLKLVRDLNDKKEPTRIAVHCVAGLGRAPVLVAIALIEFGMNPLDSIEHIRQQRRGAFNKPQIAYLDSYKRSLKPAGGNATLSLRSSLGRMFGMNKSISSQSSSTHSSSGATTPTVQQQI